MGWIDPVVHHDGLWGLAADIRIQSDGARRRKETLLVFFSGLAADGTHDVRAEVAGAFVAAVLGGNHGYLDYLRFGRAGVLAQGARFAITLDPLETIRDPRVRAVVTVARVFPHFRQRNGLDAGISGCIDRYCRSPVSLAPRSGWGLGPDWLHIRRQRPCPAGTLPHPAPPRRGSGAAFTLGRPWRRPSAPAARRDMISGRPWQLDASGCLR